MHWSRPFALAAVTVGVALAVLLGGVLRESASPAGARGAVDARVAAAADELGTGVARTRYRLDDPPARGGDPCRDGRRPHVHPARPRLPAARPRDRRSELLRALGADCSGARSRSTRPTRTPSAGSARSHSRATASATPSSSVGGPNVSRRPRPAHLGVVGDALVELGRYREAFATFDRMAALTSGSRRYARVSYARELLGARRTRSRRCELALEAGDAAARADRVDHVQLAKLHLGRGEARGGRAATTGWRSPSLPGYVYALDGLARVEAARGRPRAGARALAPCRRHHAAAAVRRHARRPAAHARADARRRASSTQLVGAIERVLRRERRAHRPRDRALRRRSRTPARARRSTAPAARTRERAGHRRRRRLGLGARAQRPL